MKAKKNEVASACLHPACHHQAHTHAQALALLEGLALPSLLGPLSPFFLIPTLEHLLPVQLNSMQTLLLAESYSQYPHFYILTAAISPSSLCFSQYHIFFQIHPSLSPTALFMLLLTGGYLHVACNHLRRSTVVMKGKLLSHPRVTRTAALDTALLDPC